MSRRKAERLVVKKLAALATATSPPEQLAAVSEVTAAAEALLYAVVADARAAGVTWTEIGAVFGMSKQAAQQRFKRWATAPGGWPAARCRPDTSRPSRRT